ncbi:MAG: SDR family NAD(P)-dependent oxidoreductase [Lentisphaeria bacterium]|nr:SDR family NAD(P)-dependent oxidoreductase [Lentisphaeria bacterium]
MMDSFENKKVLVTGGSRGLGEAICRRFASAGCQVIVNCAHGIEVAEKVAAGINGIAYACDISDEKAVARMFSDVGPVDILVNNARIDPYKRGADMTDGDWWDAVMSVNLKGAYLCGKFAFEDMKKRQWGRMIHISSLWAYQPANERMLSYAAAKSAMHALSRGFANLGATHGITSNVLAPGLIMTDLIMTRLTPEQLEKEMAGIPLGRGASTDEVAEAVFKIADTPFLTGEIINLNGGAFMRA